MKIAILEANEIHLADGKIVAIPSQVVQATKGSLEALRRWAFYMGFIGRDTELACVGA